MRPLRAEAEVVAAVKDAFLPDEEEVLVGRDFHTPSHRAKRDVLVRPALVAGPPTKIPPLVKSESPLGETLLQFERMPSHMPMMQDLVEFKTSKTRGCATPMSCEVILYAVGGPELTVVAHRDHVPVDGLPNGNEPTGVRDLGTTYKTR